MNLVLIRGGFPAIAIGPADRPAYIQALQRQHEDEGASFNQLLYGRLGATLDDYLSAARQALAQPG